MGEIPKNSLEEREREDARPESKIGLSLSLCVADILRGKVKEEEVKEIITSTNASPEDWSKLLQQYKDIYWQENPEEGVAIAQRLYEAGKIKQPRQEGGTAHNIAGGRWLDAENIDDWRRQQTEAGF